MTAPVLVDTNLLVLLIVGSASRNYISAHKRLDGYSEHDFDLLCEVISQFSDIWTVPHILAETSGIARQFNQAALPAIQLAIRAFLDGCTEIQPPSRAAAEQESFARLGLTDTVILHVCGLSFGGTSPTLLTTDTALADIALSQGYSVIDYRREYQMP